MAGNAVTAPFTIPGPVCFLRGRFSRIMSDREFDGAVNDGGNHIGFLALLLAQPPRPHQRHLYPASRVRACNSACPNPRDDRCFGSGLKGGVRVEVTDPLLGLVPHPLTVAPNILSEALSSRPPERVRLGIRMHRRHSCELRRISIIALLMSTATGLRSLACASSPNR